MSLGRRDNPYKNDGAPGSIAKNPAYREAPPRWKRYAFLAALFFLFVYFIVTGAMSLYYASRVIHPAQSPVTPINKNIAYPYTSVSFVSRDGSTQLSGWHFNAKNTANALIIVHGFGGNRFPFGEQTLDFVDAIIENDFNVLVFDLRNSGGGGAAGMSAFGLHEKDDVLGAVDYAKNAGYENIALLGVSSGANAAAMAGAEASVEEIGALILDSPIVDINSFILRLIREINPELPDFPFNVEVPVFVGLYLNGDVHNANPAGNLDKFMPRNVQIIYGNNDEIVSLSDITELYDGYMSRAVGKISIWNVPGAGHAECYTAARDEYIERVAAFLRRVFD